MFKFLFLLFISIVVPVKGLTQNIPSLAVQVGFYKTSHLVFPSDIIYVDLGHAQHYAVDYTNNILRIKSVFKDAQQELIPNKSSTDKSSADKIPSTNLTVICKDRFFYSFHVEQVNYPLVNYFIDTTQSVQNIGQANNDIPFSKFVEVQNKEPPALKKSTLKKSAFESSSIWSKDDDDEILLQIEQKAQEILQQKSLYHNLSDRHGDIRLKVTAIYHSLDHCFIAYQIQNSGPIPYDIAYTEFGIQEKKRPKQSAWKQQVLSPILILNEHEKRVLPERINRFVAVFPKLAVPNDRLVYLEVIEQGRNLTLQIPFARLKIKEF